MFNSFLMNADRKLSKYFGKCFSSLFCVGSTPYSIDCVACHWANDIQSLPLFHCRSSFLETEAIYRINEPIHRPGKHKFSSFPIGWLRRNPGPQFRNRNEYYFDSCDSIPLWLPFAEMHQLWTTERNCRIHCALERRQLSMIIATDP